MMILYDMILNYKTWYYCYSYCWIMKPNTIRLKFLLALYNSTCTLHLQLNQIEVAIHPIFGFVMFRKCVFVHRPQTDEKDPAG